MNAVLRIALGFFSFLPLQRWLNLIGLVLMVTGAALAISAADPRASIWMTAALGLPGAMLIVMVPMGLGGLALRYASTKTLLHLRPYGRLRLLLGATLAITLVAGVVAAALLTTYHLLAELRSARPMPLAMQPAAWFFAVWSFTAGAWLMAFIAGASRLLSGLVPAVVVAIVLILAPMADSTAADPRVVFAVMGAAWAMFAVWYSRTRTVVRPLWVGDRSPLGSGNYTFGLLERMSAISPGRSRAVATRAHLLGSVSNLATVAAGAIPAVVMLVVIMLLPAARRAEMDTLSFAFVMAMFPGWFSYMVARRARQLWLRTGHDRSALFRLTERVALPVALLAFGTTAAILLAASLPGRQEQAPMLILYAGATAMLATGVFYFGLSLTRSWGFKDGLLCFGMFVLAIAVNNGIKPDRDPSITALWIGAGVFAVMALLLRWHALRRWRALDWRVAMLPTAGRSNS